MKKKILEHLIVGLGLGFVFTTACLWIFKAYEASGMEVMREFTTWLGASAFYGLISLIYDSDIPFPINLIMHFIACAAVTFVACIVLGIVNYIEWYQWFIYVLPVFVVIYIIAGIAVTVSTQCQMKKLNEKIKKIK